MTICGSLLEKSTIGFKINRIHVIGLCDNSIEDSAEVSLRRAKRYDVALF